MLVICRVIARSAPFYPCAASTSSSSRAFSISPSILSKASKARDARLAAAGRKPKATKPVPFTLRSEEERSRMADEVAPRSTPTSAASLFEEVPAKESREDLAAAASIHAVSVTELEGSSVVVDDVTSRRKVEVVDDTPEAASSSTRAEPTPILTPAERRQQQKDALAAFDLPETIYEAKPPKNTALMITAAFVLSVFCLSSADLARVGWTSYDSETDSYELAPASKRYVFAGGFAAVGVVALTYGALWPARIVTKLAIRRPVGSTTIFPAGSLVELHTPITKLPLLSARIVPLEKLQLLGPLSRSPKPWHPIVFTPPPRAEPKGSVGKLLLKLQKALIAPPRAPSKTASAWSGPQKSHTPLIVRGDRANYTLARVGQEGDERPPWAVDWDALEKVLLSGPNSSLK